jgi:hypothetical protein
VDGAVATGTTAVASWAKRIRMPIRNGRGWAWALRMPIRKQLKKGSLANDVIHTLQSGVDQRYVVRQVHLALHQLVEPLPRVVVLELDLRAEVVLHYGATVNTVSI